MARYDSHKNRGFDGYGQPAYGVRPAAIMGYRVATTESYVVASTEDVVNLGGGHLAPTQIRRLRSSTRDQPDDHSPKFGHATGSPREYSPKFNGSPHDSPRKTFKTPAPPVHYPTNHGSPPGKVFHGGFSSGDEDSDGDVECRDGVCYPKPKHGGYGGGGGDYHQPKKESSQYHHQQKPEPHKYHEGKNNMYTHTKPVTRVTDPYYDNDSNAYTTSKTDHPYNGKSNKSALPAPIKTTRVPDHYQDGARNSPISAAAHRSPFGAASPRKDRREVINGTESPRRYGNAPPHSGDRKNMGTIDSETAAKLYGGVFVKS